MAHSPLPRRAVQFGTCLRRPRATLYLARLMLAGVLAVEVLFTAPAPQLARSGDNNALAQPASVQPTAFRAPADLEAMRFEPNVGQAGVPTVRFLARGIGDGIFVTATGLALTVEPAQARSPGGPRTSVGEIGVGSSGHALAVQLTLLGANPRPAIVGEDRLPGVSNYFLGDNPHRWRTGVPGFARVRALGVYPGIDVIYYGDHGNLDYDFLLAPGANPSAIRLAVGGARRLTVDAQGNLHVLTAGGDIVQRAPAIYQRGAEGAVSVAGHYVLAGAHHVGFALQRYDRRRSLVIDPILSYATYLGGDSDGHGIAVDAKGDVLVAGGTDSVGFPTATPLQRRGGGGPDVFVAKLNPTGTRLIYATYLGGSGYDDAYGIALGKRGDAYITGFTDSRNFPHKCSLQGRNAGHDDAFVVKFDIMGKLDFATYLGGDGNDEGFGIAVDGAGRSFVTGDTHSTDFPTAVPLHAHRRGGVDAFVAALDSKGSRLIYATYLGGSGADHGVGIGVDAHGNVAVTGSTDAADFPVSRGAMQPASGGGTDAFVARLTPTGRAIYVTYLGGRGTDLGQGIVADSRGDAYITGSTSSINFPTSAGAFQRRYAGGGIDGFVVKLDPSGRRTIYSTLLGGTGGDVSHGITVDSGGSAFVTGWTSSRDFPMRAPLQRRYGGGTGPGDAFVARLQPTGTALRFSTYLGGSGDDLGNAIAVDGKGTMFITGWTASNGFATTRALQRMHGAGVVNAFVVRIDQGTPVPK